MHALNILVVTTYFPAQEGRFIVNQITGLIDAGHEVTILAKCRGPNIYHSLIDQYNLCKKLIVSTRMPHNLTHYDMILCQFGYHGAECAHWLQTIPQQERPFLITCFRGADISRFVVRNPHMYNELFAVGDLFLPVCNYFKQRLIALGCPRKKIKVLHSGIDCTAFNFAPKKIDAEKPIIIMSVCRLVEKKGIEYVLEALPMIIEQYPQVQYWIVGDGDKKDMLVHKVHDLSIQEHVTFWGRQQESEIIDLLHRTHIFVLPSVTADSGDIEGIPNALKEAMSCGVPVIATDHAGNNELIKEGMGILVPEKNVKTLVTAIENIIELYNTEQLDIQLQQARTHVTKKYDMHVVNRTLKKLIEQRNALS